MSARLRLTGRRVGGVAILPSGSDSSRLTGGFLMVKVGIVGLGYVGLPLGVAFAEAGADVVGVDVDSATVAGVRDGHSHIEDVSEARLQAVLGRIEATTRYVELH